MKYNKLIRDFIPEVISKKGKKVMMHVADEREYGKKLDEKLQEEVNEFLFAKSEEEYADILEVLEAIAEFRQLKVTEIGKIKLDKKAKVGGFKKRLILDEVI